MTNKKGAAATDLIVLMVVLFVAILIFVGFIYGFNAVVSNLLNVKSPAGSPFNITSTTQQTLQVATGQMKDLQWVGLSLFFAMAIGIFISNYLVRANPVFFFVYILFTILAIVFSAYISNAYESIASGSVLSTQLQNWGATHFILMHLPIFITIIGIIGGIALFMGTTIDRETGGSIL